MLSARVQKYQDEVEAQRDLVNWWRKSVTEAQRINLGIEEVRLSVMEDCLTDMIQEEAL